MLLLSGEAEELGIAADGSKDVVEIVGHSGRQLTHGRQAL